MCGLKRWLIFLINDRLDLTHAVMLNTLLLQSFDGNSRSRHGTHKKASSSDFCDDLTTTLRAELDGLCGKFASSAMLVFVRDALDLLTCALACISNVLRTSGLDKERADHFFAQLSRFSQSRCVVQEETNDGTVCLARSIHQTAALLYNLVCNENPPGHPSMESYVDGLLVAMRKGPFWKGLPSLDLLM